MIHYFLMHIMLKAEKDTYEFKIDIYLQLKILTRISGKLCEVGALRIKCNYLNIQFKPKRCSQHPTVIGSQMSFSLLFCNMKDKLNFIYFKFKQRCTFSVIWRQIETLDCRDVAVPTLLPESHANHWWCLLPAVN